MTRLSLATLAAEAASGSFFDSMIKLLDTMLNSWAAVAGIAGLFIWLAGRTVGNAIYNHAKAVRESATGSNVDIPEIVEQVFKRVIKLVGGEIAEVRNEALDHVDRLDGNDAALKGGIEDVATHTGAPVEVTLLIAGTDFTRGDSPAPAGTEYASPEDIQAAHAAALQGYPAPSYPQTRAMRSTPQLPAGAPFNPANPESILRYVVQLTMSRYDNALPWHKVEGQPQGTTYYAMLLRELQGMSDLPLPKTIEGLWSGLSEQVQREFELLENQLLATH